MGRTLGQDQQRKLGHFQNLVQLRLVQSCLNGNENACAALLFGLLDACHEPLPNRGEFQIYPQRLPLETLYDLTMFSDPRQDVYRQLLSRRCLGTFRFVLDYYSREIRKCGCSSWHGGSAPLCKAKGAAVWQLFVPILELLDPETVKVEPGGDYKKPLGRIQDRVADFVAELEKRRECDNRYLDHFKYVQNMFTTLRDLAECAMNHEDSDPLLPSTVIPAYEGPREFENNFKHLERLARKDESTELTIAYWSGHMDQLQEIVQEVKLTWPVPESIVFERILQLRLGCESRKGGV